MYVRVGTQIAPPPEHVARMIESLFDSFESDFAAFPIGKIAKTHLEFETIHPFLDGNGRIGRVMMNYQLMRQGLPSIIIKDKERQTYYAAFREYNDTKAMKSMEKIVALALT